MSQQRIKKVIGEQEVAVICEASQAEMARDLLNLLDNISQKSGLQAGVRVRYGWSLLTLREDGLGGLIVCEPDFQGNPMKDTLPKVDTTLEVLGRQMALVHRVGVTPVDVGFEQQIVVRRNAFAASNLQLFRATPSDTDDSGWSIQQEGAVPSDQPEDFFAIRVFELLSLHSPILAVLTLPPGFAASFEDDDLIAVLDPEGNDRLQNNQNYL